MTRLRVPLRDELRDTTPRAGDVERLWGSLEERRRGRRRKVVWLSLPATALALLALVVLWRPWRGPAGPLRLADGSPLAALDAPTGARAVAFADGSRLELEGQARVEPLVDDAHDVTLAVRRGRARFDIAATARRWTIDAGPISFQIVAPARFAIWRSDDKVEVRVFEGALIVHGTPSPQRLTAGASLELPLTSASPAAAPAPAPMPPAPPPAAAAPAAAAPAAAPATPKAWKSLAAKGRYSDAYRALGPRGTAAEAPASLDELLQLADVARLSGHPAEAVPLLTRASRDPGRDPRAALAAFTLGRVEADDLHHPRAAAAAFDHAITRGLPAALAETACERLVESLTAAGDSDGARAAARRCLDRHPSGPSHDRLQHLLDAAPAP